MSQPTPPGDLPLIEGLGPEWNDIVSAFPEDRRSELAPKLKERISGYTELEGWRDLQNSKITPDQASVALNLMSTIENNPRQIYDTIGQYLGITPQQAEQIVEQIEEGDEDDPRIKTLQDQVNTMVQIQLAERNMAEQKRMAAEQDQALESELGSLKKKYGDVDEREVVMRMLHLNMTAEQAYQDYTGRDAEIMKRRPSPFVMGSGGNIPSRQVDVTKLDGKDTRNIVAQMIQHANNERNA